MSVPVAINVFSRRRFITVLVALLLLLLALTLASVLMGSAQLSPAQVFAALTGDQTQSTAYDVLWNLRLPRTLLAMVVGIHFALSGLILQSVIRNPLADPGVIGVSSGASLAIVVFLLLADWLSQSLLAGHTIDGQPMVLSLEWIPFAALVGGMLVSALVLSLSWKDGISPARLALNGVAIGAVLNAAVMWIVVVWGGSRTETTILWLAGSLYGRDFSHFAVILPWTLLGLIGLMLIQHPLSLLRFNQQQAQTMGLNVARWRVLSISIAVALAASAIAVAGPLGFVGLIVPHLARLLVGGQLRYLILASLLAGACLTLSADIISRTLLSPIELPAGALTTLIGIPVLLYLLQTQIPQGNR